jgi:hypothetical protein
LAIELAFEENLCGAGTQVVFEKLSEILIGEAKFVATVDRGDGKACLDLWAEIYLQPGIKN